MDVRDMNGDPGMWEGLKWDDLNAKEQELWGDLGWRREDWNKNEAPPSADKEWSELTDRERTAAEGLGFTEGLWNGFEDE